MCIRDRDLLDEQYPRKTMRKGQSGQRPYQVGTVPHLVSYTVGTADAERAIVAGPLPALQSAGKLSARELFTRFVQQYKLLGRFQPCEQLAAFFFDCLIRCLRPLPIGRWYGLSANLPLARQTPSVNIKGGNNPGRLPVTDSEQPYLTTRDQTLWAVGPGRFELDKLLADPAQGLEHIIYLQPVENPKGCDRRVDIRAFVDDSCGPYIEPFPTQPGARLASIPAGDIRIAVSARRLLCAPR